MQTFLANYWLDIVTTTLGIAYIILEYHASIWLWLVGFLMQSLGIALYYQKGLYADCGMEFYYLAVTIYGFFAWKFGRKGGKRDNKQLPITHFPRHLMLLWLTITAAIWAAIYFILTTYTDSKVPIADSFTTALSVVGIWALARKYVEQWIIWIVVDIVTCMLYYYKDIPFKATLYAFYVIVAIIGYRKWKAAAISNVTN
ncbi:MAG: nicotinamide mononucleotide transporter [Prevotella sp.]|nr:nicotinamide mononucleotide transporter [Prevotella sp.]